MIPEADAGPAPIRIDELDAGRAATAIGPICSSWHRSLVFDASANLPNLITSGSCSRER
jgi:hypothetical protein